MNPRTIRRAIERKEARKAQKEASKTQMQAYKEMVKSLAVEPGSSSARAIEEELAAADEIISELQLVANRRNAQLSTGPTSPEGKASSSRNALKTGLTGRTVLLPNEDAARYEHHLQSFVGELNPLGDRETELVQSIADSKWRLARIPSLEFGIYALGRIQFAEEFQSLPKPEAAILVEVKTHLHYQKQLNNLSIQESRLRRQAEKDTAELTRIQQLRKEAERAAVKKAASSTASAKPEPRENGFEFATALTSDELTSLERHLNLDSGLLALPKAA